MQSATATFIAAEAAQERRPILRVLCDWDNDGYGATGSIDDLTGQVEAVTIRRALQTDLPEVVKIVTGRSTASAEITIATGDKTDPTKTAAWYYGEDNTASPIYGKARQFRPVKIELGFITTAGPEYLTVFTGRTRDVSVDRAAGTVTIECLDASELFRGNRQLPSVLADDRVDPGGIKPGLSGSFLIDWGLRRQGFYSSPAPRAGCKVLVTMHGSAFPEVGTPANLFSGLRAPINFTAAGPFLDAVVLGGVDTTKLEYFTAGAYVGDRFNFRMDPTRTVTMEGWLKASGTITDRGVAGVFTGTSGVGLFINVSGNLAIYQRTPDSGPHITNTNFNVGDGAWHYVGLRVTYGTNTAAAKVVMDASSAAFGTPSGFNNTTTSPQPPMTICHVQKCYTAGGTLRGFLGWLADWQFSEEDPDTTTGWNQGFTPSSTVHTSTARMLATPGLDGALWDAMQVIAEAEFGALILDETGQPTFYTRAALNAAPFTTVQATLTSTTFVKNLVTATPIDSVRNWIKVGGVLPQIQAAQALWRAESRIKIPGTSSNEFGYGNGKRVLSVGYAGPVYNMDTSFVYGASLGLNESGYRANTEIDGSGSNISNLTVRVTYAFADHAFIEVTNPNASAVYLVNGNGIAGVTQGQPCLLLWGQQVTWDQGAYASRLAVDKRDATSMATYGEQYLELLDNPARQDLDAFDTLTPDLLAYLKNPTRTLRSVPMRALLRLQLADRVRLQDTSGSMLDGEFRITALETTCSKADGLSQSVDLRTA